MTDHNLTPEDLDRLGQALLTLTNEIWVLRDRLRILEAALEQAGVADVAALDTFEPDDALADALAKDRRELIGRVLTALGGALPEEDS